ncbi:hypothetical protein GYMLUDRAFT_63581 [Collybiopsis luxurians FD-317 M1]|uniref:Uncharacterized protein n=1 Tax=Collybiopsis luxurians FD-317 M1 TaxID=944289 RepID=A0A0D0BVJ7_9AGAR|nr:hypothetical protein GYMLUDRAFT_63581 [Collybiopsis luxurians FD-317 M1]
MLSHALQDDHSSCTGSEGNCSIFWELRDGDVHGIEQDAMDLEREAVGTTEVSWIWSGLGINPTDQATIDKSLVSALRITWCKARAQAYCWQEEGILLQEEMCCTLETLEFEAQQWAVCAGVGSSIGELTECSQEMLEVAQGCEAYGARQAAIQRKIQAHCKTTWADVLAKLRTGVGASALEDDKWAFA